MQATEVPEIIYIDRNPYPLNGSFDHHWYYAPMVSNKSIEYTRTDVFIEKACKAFCKLCKMPNCNSLDCSYLKDFRNHMK